MRKRKSRRKIKENNEWKEVTKKKSKESEEIEKKKPKNRKEYI